MGRDLSLYTDHASKSDLVSLVKSLGEVRTTEHLWDWPKGSVHFHWFDEIDYRSTTGVEITIYPVGEKEKRFGSGSWAMHVRNTYSATWHDVNMLNRFLREARKKFGGNIIGDYGKNRYAPLWEDDSTPMSRGYAWMHSMAHNNLNLISFSLPSERTIPADADEEMRSFIGLTDPSRVLYNGLIPFLISILEFYLKNILVISLRYDNDTHERIKLHETDADLTQLDTINRIANSISFQDLKNVRKSFKKWFNIDIKLLLNEPSPTSGKALWVQLIDLIKYRHDIIHEMGVDNSLSRDKFLEWSQVVDKTLDVLLKEFAEKYQLDLHSILASI